MSTIKQIAYLAGVSRGTVDRVLNHRGSVNPETARKITAIAEAMHYSPNQLGKRLAVAKKKLKFGYILFGSTASNPFFEDVVMGIEKRALELEAYGVSVETRFTSINNPKQQVNLMDELVAGGANGLVISPINHPLVAEKIRLLAKAGVPVVTVNSDLPGSGRLAYVGSNYHKSGETAAGLLGLITGGVAQVGILMGSPLVLCHAERVAGFEEILQARFPQMQIVATAKNNDDDLKSYAVTKALLHKYPQINALFFAAAGVFGACRAVDELGLAGTLRIVSFDTVPITRQLVKEGFISATIGQQPAIQGRKPLDLLLDYLGLGIKPGKDCYYTNLEIKIRENI